MSATEAGTTLLDGAAILRAGDQTSIPRPRRALLTDRAHGARGRAAVAHGALHLLHDCLVVRGNRRDCEFRLYEHNLVAAGLKVSGSLGRLADPAFPVRSGGSRDV